MSHAALLAILPALTLACNRPFGGSGIVTSNGVPSSADVHEGLLYGRVTVDSGIVYEGRIRFGQHEEALWGNNFNGYKEKNPWIAYVAADRRPKERRSISLFGVTFSSGETEKSLTRPFMARFGDLARIEAHGRDLQVVLKSGTVVHLDRYDADDLADAVFVWDTSRGAVALNEWPIRKIEFGQGPRRGTAPLPLFGTVHTARGDFTGLIQWDREKCLNSDELSGRASNGERRVRFDTIRSIARRSRDSAAVTLADGSTIELSGTRDVGRGNRGVYVDDRRYGRVLISWEALERVDFRTGGTGPAYGDYPPGRAITGSVTTRTGRRLAGRLVYDLDESETTDTLDAPSHGIDYNITFDLVRSIVLPDHEQASPQQATVTLRSGETLALDLAGDLGAQNAGVLIFSDGLPEPEYVTWTEVERVDLDAGGGTRAVAVP